MSRSIRPTRQRLDAYAKGSGTIRLNTHLHEVVNGNALDARLVRRDRHPRVCGAKAPVDREDILTSPMLNPELRVLKRIGARHRRVPATTIGSSPTATARLAGSPSRVGRLATVVARMVSIRAGRPGPSAVAAPSRGRWHSATSTVRGLRCGRCGTLSPRPRSRRSASRGGIHGPPSGTRLTNSPSSRRYSACGSPTPDCSPFGGEPRDRAARRRDNAGFNVRTGSGWTKVQCPGMARKVTGMLA